MYTRVRSPLLTPEAVVATSQPLAASAGLEMLRRGGNAVDAAIAAAICLTVVEPCSNGIGSDLVAQVWQLGRVHGLNGTGRAPAAAPPSGVDRRVGWHSVVVPGAPRAWLDLHGRFGALPFEELFAPAIGYARDGFPLSPVVWQGFAAADERYRTVLPDHYDSWASVFAPDGVPTPGEFWRSPRHAETLQDIAETRAESFYEGELAHAIVGHAETGGGVMSLDDLAGHRSEWVEPLSVSYRDHEIWETPPNTQGIAVLIALRVLDAMDGDGDPKTRTHEVVEATKAALALATTHATDPDFHQVDTEWLLSDDLRDRLVDGIGESAGVPDVGFEPGGGTVYLCAADGDGLVVSLIQSNYEGFGSGIVVPDTGIALNNRAAAFSLDPLHVNRFEPGKRPFHTIIPGLVTRGSQCVGPFGVMGGMMQAQGHVQFLANTFERDMDPQAALDAPRWRWLTGREVVVETDMASSIVEELQSRAHEVVLEKPSAIFGRGQAIWSLPDGGYIAGSDKRADGQAVGI